MQYRLAEVSNTLITKGEGYKYISCISHCVVLECHVDDFLQKDFCASRHQRGSESTSRKSFNLFTTFSNRPASGSGSQLLMTEEDHGVGSVEVNRLKVHAIVEYLVLKMNEDSKGIAIEYAWLSPSKSSSIRSMQCVSIMHE